MNNNFKIGMQSWFVTEFLDEGIDNALNSMIDEAGVNMLLLGTHVDYMSANSWVMRLGHSNKDNIECEGYNYDIDLKYYERTRIKPIKSKIPEIKNRDIFGEISRSAKEKGLEVYALILHRFQELDRYEDFHMRAVNGQKIPGVLCHNNPEVKKFYKCMIDHLDDKYNIDGFCYCLLDHYSLFGFESLTDELADTLGIKKFSNPEMGLSCFCEVCIKQAKEKGIDVERVKKGLLKGVEFGYIPEKVERMVRADEAIRFLLDVPEYLEWLKFRSSRLTDLHKSLYEYIKNKNDNYKVGLDIYGARDDWKYQIKFQDITKFCDWVKPMFYSSTYKEPLSSEEVGEGVRLAKYLSKKPIYPGIYCVVGESEKKIKGDIECALKNGANGVILSWDYALIPYGNMNIVKDKLKELRII